MTKPLSHIRVLDMSRVLAGPFVAQNLADLGAEVIKVERPRIGDESRALQPFLRDQHGIDTSESAYFMSINRGKKSMTVDLSKPQGQAIVLELAKKSDVVIENYKVGTLKRYGLDYDSLSAVNPRIVYCSITGYGQSGPYSDRPGYDYIAQAVSGLMSVTGERDDLPGAGPAKVGMAVCDVFTGMYASLGVVAALAHVQRTGIGQHIDIALLDSQIAANAHINVKYLVSDEVPRRLGTAHPSIVPCQLFECSDRPIVIMCNDGQFQRLCEVIGLPELAADDRFKRNSGRAKHRTLLLPLLAEAIEKKSAQEWVEALAKARIPCGPVNDLEQVFDDPHVRHRQMRRDVPHPMGIDAPLIANPIRFSKTPVTYDSPPPLLGQHTSEILRTMLGMDERQIQRLVEDEVV